MTGLVAEGADIYFIKECNCDAVIRLHQSREKQIWSAELNLRHLKTTLGMDILRGQTPAMVRKEIYVHLLAYNLLRSPKSYPLMNQPRSVLRQKVA